MSRIQLPWYCATCETKGRSTIAEKVHFIDHKCPRCGSEDIFEDEVFQGDICKRPIRNEEFAKPELANSESLIGISCLKCHYKSCELEFKPMRTINFIPAS